MNKLLSLTAAIFITTSVNASKIDIFQDSEAYVANAQKNFKGTFKTSLLSTQDSVKPLEEQTLEVSFKPLAHFTSVEVPSFSRYVGDSEFVRFSGVISFGDAVISLNDFVQSGLVTDVKLNISSTPLTATFLPGNSSH
ncbi:hypothetical protein [Candidatus Nucleicultrix amoebiphila]|jgi:hypothetical protein|uniref:Uncharacterized protein n=1 Tax=Candidatus Nucleicultrix amoebiphila FS5 TaxID=1414854 RepID=A0A1W6N3S4_9PROT|nr:hypothetical protein [Candidatus Nucleicultrix amoebiphila]ARN84408.1 hypothetical protein GQ61_02690 [Candidatus Nucleicultrix amoebiphila FS5]